MKVARTSSGFVDDWDGPEFGGPLPGVAAEMADEVGRVPTLFLIQSLPPAGRRRWRVCVYVPHRMRVDHPLIWTLGFRHAERLRRGFGGEILQPSNCRFLERAWRDVAIWRMWQESEQEDWTRGHYEIPVIASLVRLSEYRVREILRGKPPEDRHLVLSDCRF